MECNTSEIIMGSMLQTSLSGEDYRVILALLSTLFEDIFKKLDRVCHTFKQVTLGWQTYGTSASRLLRSCNILAHRIDEHTQEVALGAGTITEFMQVRVHLQSGLQTLQLSVAKVNGFGDHPECSTHFPPPVQAWTNHAAFPSSLFMPS